MRGGIMGDDEGRHRNSMLLFVTIAVAFSTYIDQVVSLPVEAQNQWPTFPRRNIAALARDGYLKNGPAGFKRSISTLAKNGQLPTFRAPYDEDDQQEQDSDESHEKRHIASIARMRSYAAKRNIQALARDGYRGAGGRSQYQQSDKRNIQALARNGLLIHKKDEIGGDEYFYPFYQNPIPPLSEIDGPFDYNELYDLQQSVNPDMFPPLSQVYKRSAADDELAFYNDYLNFKRGSAGLPVHGLYRPVYADTSRSKRYVMSIPDVIDHNGIHDSDDTADNANEDKRSVDEDSDFLDFEKRHIGSLARLGLLPSFRFGGGRYSRSGRARLMLPSQEMYRKHSPDENFGIREYFTSPEIESAVDPDDALVPAAAVPAHSHPTGRILHRPLNNDVPPSPLPAAGPLPSPPLPPPSYIDSITKNRWHSNSKETPRFYYFRSLKVPYHTDKRYLLIPAVDNILLRKNYRNSSLPGRRKNQ